MPFEYGFIPEGDDEKQPAGCIVGGNPHAIPRFDYDGSYEVVVLRPAGDTFAEIFILPEEDFDLDHPDPVLLFTKFTNDKRDGKVTPSQPYKTHFQNEDGDRATLYVNYLPVGARILFLADGRIKFVSEKMI